MQHSDQSATAGVVADGARELQAKLYREIGISAVAAALHSISKPEPSMPVAQGSAGSLHPVSRAIRAA